MPKRFSLKSVGRRGKAGESQGGSEQETYTIVSRSPVVATRTLDGQIVSPGSATTTTSRHKYGTVRTTQMTVVETRVKSSRPESSSSSSTLAKETSQLQGGTLAVPSGGSQVTTTTTRTFHDAIELPKPAVRKKILGQQQSSGEWATGEQMDSQARSSSEAGGGGGEGGQSSRGIISSGSVGGGGKFGGGIGSSDQLRAGLDEQPTSVSNLPGRLSRVPADFSAPQQLPVAETTLANRAASPAASSSAVRSSSPGGAASPNARRSPREPDELTAIRPSPTTNINPSGPDSPTPTIRDKRQRQQQQHPSQDARKSPQQQSTKGVHPLTSALTPAPGNLFPTASDEDGGSTGDEPRQHYPKKVLLIVANEFCERFSYYGLRTVLVLYFHNVLGYSDSGAAISFHLFAALCYITPILGAILGDSILGKYKTILYMSIVYFFGELFLVLASVWWNLGPWSVVITWFSLILIGLGTGGIKPCVSAFGGDQFRPSEVGWREGFFSLFYGAINLGSLISMFATPMLRAQNRCVGRSDCYPLAFLIPCILMFVSIVVFLLASGHYYHAPLPEQNVILAFCRCTWLALKRKLAGQKLPLDRADPAGQLLGYTNPSLSDSGSNISLSETTPGDTESKQLASPGQQATMGPADGRSQALHPSGSTKLAPKRNHWLYLASDRFDTNSIEEFRCCLGIFLLFVPMPVYWALYDQQSSLWTLQATRMDGHLFGSKLVLEPDQMGVLNPLILLASIPLFQFVIYPALGRCNLLTTPIQRMTTGGVLMALTFVSSALIEMAIQQHLPMETPQADRANLILVNGLNDCSLVGPQIVHALQSPPANITTEAAPTQAPSLDIQAIESALLASLQPLSSRSLEVVALSNSSLGVSQSQIAASKSPYKLTFRLASSVLTGEKPYSSYGNYATLNSTLPQADTPAAAAAGCPLDPSQMNELAIGPLGPQSVRLLYVEQGNGKLGYKLFEDSLALAPSGKARVRLLYEFFGSYSRAQKRQFRLHRNSGTALENSKPGLTFTMSVRDGQVLLSDYLDLDVPSHGDYFTLMIVDEKGQPMAGPSQQERIFFDCGTRNLLVLHQTDARGHKLRREVLQDSRYKISIIHQLIPYTLISFSEVLFSITGLEFSYAMAPPDMKSLVVAAFTMTSAFGNLLTVAIESAHLFPNIAYDFLFYAVIMLADMLLFAIIGYHYEPYEPALASQSKRARKIQ